MTSLTVRNVSSEIHRALRLRAAEHGRSTEAEMRAILENTVKPPQDLRMGEAMSRIGQRWGLTNDDLDALDQARQRTPAEPMHIG